MECNGGCQCCRPDHLRVLTLVADGSAGTPFSRQVELPPNARVYFISLTCDTDGGVAVLYLQDNALVAGGPKIASSLPPNPFNAPLPGLVWPAEARFSVDANIDGALRLVYGECVCA